MPRAKTGTREQAWWAKLEILAESVRAGAYPLTATHPLYGWMHRQRLALRRGVLPPGCLAALCTVFPGWEKEPKRRPVYRCWYERFGELQLAGDLSKISSPLQQWVYRQKAGRSRLTDEQAQLLESIPGWKWATAARPQRPITAHEQSCGGSATTATTTAWPED